MEGEGKLKAPRRVHLEALADQGDTNAWVELNCLPPLSSAVEHIWRSWLDISSTRPTGGLSIMGLTRHDIHAYEQDEGISFEPWERRLIFRIDAVWRASVQKEEGETK